MAGPWAEASLTSSQFFPAPGSWASSGGEGPETTNLWADLLKEVAENKHNTLPSRSLLVLGDRDSGKTTLLAKLQGNEDPKKGSGLEFGYIDVRDEEGDEHTLLNHFVLDGDVAHSNLLQFALTEGNIDSTTVLVCSSLAQPWNVLDQLEKWIGVLQAHIDQLSLTGTRVQQLRAAKQKRWETYSEPGCDFPSSPRRYTPTTQFPLTDLSPSTEERPGPETLEEEGILVRNLGLDLVIVLTKSDAMTQLEAEHALTDQHFDFIQQAVRRLCLTYGASLFYTSVKEDKNCDLLYKYLVHTNYNFPMTTPALVVERDALFIPAGWDSMAKISILHENLFKFNPEQNFGEVIKSPFAGKGGKPAGSRGVEVVAESEQDFLARLAPFLVQESGAGHSPGLAAHLLHSPESVLKTPERRLAGSPGVHSALKRSEFGPGKTPNDGAISNFFHALLQKKTGSPAQLPVVEPADILSDKVLPHQVEGQTKLPEDVDKTKVVQQMELSSSQIRS